MEKSNTITGFPMWQGQNNTAAMKFQFKDSFNVKTLNGDKESDTIFWIFNVFNANLSKFYVMVDNHVLLNYHSDMVLNGDEISDKLSQFSKAELAEAISLTSKAVKRRLGWE